MKYQRPASSAGQASPSPRPGPSRAWFPCSGCLLGGRALGEVEFLRGQDDQVVGGTRSWAETPSLECGARPSSACARAPAASSLARKRLSEEACEDAVDAPGAEWSDAGVRPGPNGGTPGVGRGGRCVDDGGRGSCRAVGVRPPRPSGRSPRRRRPRGRSSSRLDHVGREGVAGQNIRRLGARGRSCSIGASAPPSLRDEVGPRSAVSSTPGAWHRCGNVCCLASTFSALQWLLKGSARHGRRSSAVAASRELVSPTVFRDGGDPDALHRRRRGPCRGPETGPRR